MSRPYLGSGISPVERVEVVHCPNRAAPGVGHDPEHMEVMTESVCGEQQHPAGIKTHGGNRLRGMSWEVGN